MPHITKIVWIYWTGQISWVELYWVCMYLKKKMHNVSPFVGDVFWRITKIIPNPSLLDHSLLVLICLSCQASFLLVAEMIHLKLPKRLEIFAWQLYGLIHLAFPARYSVTSVIHFVDWLLLIQVLKKIDMLRKNDIDRILAERNILITVRNPFVVTSVANLIHLNLLYLKKLPMMVMLIHNIKY